MSATKKKSVCTGLVAQHEGFQLPVMLEDEGAYGCTPLLSVKLGQQYITANSPSLLLSRIAAFEKPKPPIKSLSWSLPDEAPDTLPEPTEVYSSRALDFPIEKLETARALHAELGQRYKTKRERANNRAARNLRTLERNYMSDLGFVKTTVCEHCQGTGLEDLMPDGSFSCVRCEGVGFYGKGEEEK